jgi:bZIP-type transcription factor MBZ1
LTPSLRPQNLTPSRVSSSSLSSILSGKSRAVYSSPPPSPRLGRASFASGKEVPTPQQALLAAMASQTLLERLGGAFWQAFTTHASLNDATLDARMPTWDADKIRRVLEGKAVVRVVDVEPEEKTVAEDAKMASKECSVLEEGMRALSLEQD